MDYVSKARHQEHLESCVGRQVVQLEFSSGGDMVFKFDNGLEIEISDGYCYTHFNDEVGSGCVFEDKTVTIPVQRA
jgi:hypothetical protein